MSELRYPNESREYRDARESLLKDEQELIDKVKSLAERRRNLPLGGQLKEDYVFQWANDGKVGKSVKFSELFADKNTLLLYSFMYGPSWDNPCPSCTSLVDGFDRTWYQVTQDAAFAAIAKAPADREEILLVPIDRAKIEETRQNWPFLRDRRVDAYGGLGSRLLDLPAIAPR